MQIKQCFEIKRHFASRFKNSRELIDLAFIEFVSSLNKAKLSFVVF